MNFKNSVRRDIILHRCRSLLNACDGGLLGRSDLPEDDLPAFADREEQLAYFTLPMGLNYRRSSSQLWSSLRAAFEDPESKHVFSVRNSALMSLDELCQILQSRRISLQPNRHPLIWKSVADTIYRYWGSVESLVHQTGGDFMVLRDEVQVKNKRGFPYLSGPKLFNYWAYVLNTRGGVPFKNGDLIDIAVDIHVYRSSERIGIIGAHEVGLGANEVAHRWRETLSGTEIAPAALNTPLWLWSRNGFAFQLEH